MCRTRFASRLFPLGYFGNCWMRCNVQVVQSAYNQWPQNLPVMLMSGREDPVGDGGKGVEYVAKQMKKAGIEDLSMFLMPRARHDVLHEVENGVAEKSISMIVAFLEHCVTVSECL